MNSFHLLPACRIEQVVREDTGVTVSAVARRRGAPCPGCRRQSSAVHSTYVRSPADLPTFGERVRLRLRVRRYYCRQASCPRRTFAEPLPALLAPRARRTHRLAAAQSAVGVALGGEAGARLLTRLAMPASADTVLRTVRQLPLPAHPTPRALGVDDWAVRTRCTYGTILVDLEAHRVVDLLPDRTSATLAAWLGAHPGVAVIARDRSTEYARGATLGAPAAVQVADRWHLLLNVRQMAERWLAGVHGRLRQLPPVRAPVPPVGGPPAPRAGAFRRTRAEAEARVAHRARWLAVYDDVRRRHAAGEPLLRISRTLGLARSTVRRYAYAEHFPERAARAAAPSILDPYLAHLEARRAAGCENALALWREIRTLGFGGTARQVHYWLRERRTVAPKNGPREWRAPTAAAPPAGPGAAPPALPSPTQLAWLLVQAPAALAAPDAAAVARVEQDADAARVVSLVRRFAEIVRERSVTRGATAIAPCDTFETWLAEARACGVRAVETFATGLAQDGGAVRAALTTPWSNAQSEGQITKLKLLKRQMYGRANFDLLRRRVLLAA